MAVRTIPEGRRSITPRLFVSNVEKQVAFLKYAFRATGEFRTDTPCDIQIGDSIVMVSDASAIREPMPAFLYLYLEDIDNAYRRALEAGATSLEEPTDMFYGDRRAMVRDPFGNIWQIATHMEDLPLEEIRKRAAALPR